MIYRIASARPMGWTLCAMAALLLSAAAPAFAQAPAAPAATPAPAKPAPKPAAKPAAPAAAPAAQPAPAAQGAPAGQPASPQAQADQLQLMYSPWMKVCQKGPEAGAKQVCAVAKDGRIENGMPVVVVTLIEPEGEQRKIMRVTVPPGMHLQHGTRLIIDQGTPATAPYLTCIPNGCISDYEANADMVGKMKKGQWLTVQAINMSGAAISLPLPLADFAKAYDGPATDPKVFEEQQKKLQDELQKKADEARKKIESQPQASAPAAAPK
jgi:invasion protein IalB